jgi:protein-tyrosine phosphatase
MSRSFTEADYDSINLVSDRLFHTSLAGCSRLDDLKKLGITHVVSLIEMSDHPGRSWIHELERYGIRYAVFYIRDSININPETFHEIMDETCKYLSQIHTLSHLATVVVHCVAGKSRSAACIMNYWLSKNSKLSVDTSLSSLKRKRPCVLPNPTFLRLLKEKYNQSERWM